MYRPRPIREAFNEKSDEESCHGDHDQSDDEAHSEIQAGVSALGPRVIHWRWRIGNGIEW